MRTNSRDMLMGSTVRTGWILEGAASVLGVLESLAAEVIAGKARLVGRGGPQKRALEVTARTLQAVVAGSRLPQHLRMLCGAFGLDGRGTVQILGSSWDQREIWQQLMLLVAIESANVATPTPPMLTVHQSVAAAA